MNKEGFTEMDSRAKFITPDIICTSGCKWEVMTQILEGRSFSAGRVIVHGKSVSCGKAKKADYILLPEWMWIERQEQTGLGGRIDLLAVSLVLIEIRARPHSRDVVAQALDYAAWTKTPKSARSHSATATLFG